MGRGRVAAEGTLVAGVSRRAGERQGLPNLFFFTKRMKSDGVRVHSQIGEGVLYKSATTVSGKDPGSS